MTIRRQQRPIAHLATIVAAFIGVVACANAQIAEQRSLTIDEQISMAREDLAKTLAVSVDDITVDTARMVNWRSGAAGCPKPGMNYTMAVVPGVLIILNVGGELYRYHAGRNGQPSYCPAERAEPPVFGQGEEVM
jgi:hypothetical protein